MTKALKSYRFGRFFVKWYWINESMGFFCHQKTYWCPFNFECDQNCFPLWTKSSVWRFMHHFSLISLKYLLKYISTILSFSEQFVYFYYSHSFHPSIRPKTVEKVFNLISSDLMNLKVANFPFMHYFLNFSFLFGLYTSI